MNLHQIVDDYQRLHKPAFDQELAYFATQPSLSDAISDAASARMPYGKHSHQRRRSVTTLQAAADALLQVQSDIEGCAGFDDLYNLVRQVAGGIPDFGELCVYDTALRIGSYLGLMPEQVYLHAGTRKGAHNLQLDGGAKSLPRSAFPPVLQSIGGADLENLLCLCKDVLTGVGGATPVGCRPATAPPNSGARNCR